MNKYAAIACMWLGTGIACAFSPTQASDVAFGATIASAFICYFG